MLPLGDVWAGTCHASPIPAAPDESSLVSFCNLGYARGACTRFQDDDGPDSIRFSISSDEGGLICLYYVVERDHHPYAHGPLAFDTARRDFTDPPSDDSLRLQAHAYLSSYLRRKAEASVR